MDKNIPKQFDDNHYEFVEDGEVVRMEINNEPEGTDFQSEQDKATDNECSDKEDKEDEAGSENSDSESKADEASDSSKETEVSTNDEETEEAAGTPASLRSTPAKKKKKKSRRQSVEDQLTTMSSTFLAMQELLRKNGIAEKVIVKETRAVRQTGKGADTSLSKTTIYHNVLDRVAVPEQEQPIELNGSHKVDSEITFNMKGNAALTNKQGQNHNGTEPDKVYYSSDERIDTSDELMEVDLDFNEKFIADCAAEAVNRRKRSYPEEDCNEKVQVKKSNAKEQAVSRIRDIETNKIRLMTTPGNEKILSNIPVL